MHITDDGTRLIIDMPGSKLMRAGALGFATLTALFVVMIAYFAFGSPSVATVDCDRARGTCELRRAHRVVSAPIADIASVELVHTHGTRNSSPGDYGVFHMRDGQTLEFGESVYESTHQEHYRSLMAGLKGFLNNPAETHFADTYSEQDADWLNMIMFVFILPLAAFTFGRLAIANHLELDRNARSIQQDMKPLFGRRVSKSIAFADVKSVLVSGNQNWATLSLFSSTANCYVARLPRTKAGREALLNLINTLTQSIGVPLDAPADMRRAFQLPQA